MMDAVIDQSAEHGLDEVVIGMPHRGRLNVLANIVGKPYSQIFTEFEGNLNPALAHGSGDVKYHLGASGTYIQMFGDNDIEVSLTANPRTSRRWTRYWKAWCAPSRIFSTWAPTAALHRGAADAAR